MALNFEKYAQEGNEFLNELARELGHPEERDAASRILRAVLHNLRDRIEIAESFNLLSQLPMFLKAVYVEQWRYHEKPQRIKSMEAFKEEVKKEQAGLGEREFGWDISTEDIIKTVIHCLGKYVTPGQLQHIKANLPQELKEIIEVEH